MMFKNLKATYQTLIESITVFPSSEAAESLISERAAEGVGMVISFVNAHAFNMCSHDKEFLSALSASDLVMRDGIGVKLLFRMLGKDPGYNLNGTDLIPKLLANSFKGKKVAMLGSTDKELVIAKEKIEAMGLNVVLTQHGFLPEADYLALLEGLEVDVVLLAMGMPKQEKVAVALKSENSAISIINGGAIVDFMAGKVNRAPKFYRDNGLEWLYRLVSEPKRLFKRYVIGNFLFIIRSVIYSNSN
ncbi:glycosyltransferase [Corallincola holothuriorum]|uniref:Glycosyltransferase n=1 Tax=Corallincola holothuriorum TaxID=2282215 RepID=A0A368NJ62_9GAMM|nr:WecB/TagA/CpsF family glycosyltransferase [Corallincola holothuriorum]RCU49459.1 glycosyltransferase [Corallincola holothuriorum]